LDAVRFEAEDRIRIDRSPEVVFDFLRDPRHGVAVTPLEDRVTGDPGEPGIHCRGDVCYFRLEIAAREVSYEGHCEGFERPRELKLRLEGGLDGRQAWRFEPLGDGDATEVTLHAEMVMPRFMHPYLQQPAAAHNWGEMLVRETLENLKQLLEGGTGTDD
jgi:hypothetical protein